MGELTIEARGLVKRYGDVTAVNSLDLQVQRNECVGLLGPNGAGKTTTLEILEGLKEATSGEVKLLGKAWSTDRAWLRDRMGLQLQSTQFEEMATVEETLLLFQSFYRRPRAVEEVIRLVHLEEKRDVLTHKLSGGQAQRLALAVALVGDPEILFLDEPTTGLDPQARRTLWDTILELKAQGRTVMLTTHYMEEAERLCDRIIIMDKGRSVAEGTPRELIRRYGGEQVIEFSAATAPSEAELTALPGVGRVRFQEGTVQVFSEALHLTLPRLTALLESRDSGLQQLSTRSGTLEDVFLALTGRKIRES